MISGTPVLKGERCRAGQDHADALLRTIGELDRVADALAVEIDIGLLDDTDIFKL